MAGTSIGNIWAALRIDGSLAKSDAEKAGGEAGEAAQKGMAARLKTGAKVIGAAVAGGLTVALTGRMVDLERATANFRKETGATAKEAERAGKAINDMAGRNLQPIEEIGATLTKVHTDLGLTGDEAERVTEQFLKFGQATGQNATEAVLAFDDVLDAWGLTAADAQGIMDALIVSHQRYGGSIQDNQRMLAQLAPSLKAANLDWEQANGLLNLFARAGVDSEAATTAFNRAVSKVHSPEELQTMLEQIAATKNDFDRAKLSAELFGNRAGPKLALALADSGGDLDTFTVKVNDAKGATDKAADASLTLGDRIKQAFSGIVSTATEVLGPAGPLLTAIGGLGPLLAPALSKAWKAVVGNVGLKAAVGAAGAAAGAIYSGAEAVVSAVVAGMAAVWAKVAASPVVLAAAASAGEAAGVVYAGSTTAVGFLKGFLGQAKALLTNPAVMRTLGPLLLGQGGDETLGGTDPKLGEMLRRLSDDALRDYIAHIRAHGDEASIAFAEAIWNERVLSNAAKNAVAITTTWGTTIGKAAMDGAADGVAANGDHFIVVAGEQGEAAAVASADAVASNADKARWAWRTLMSEGLEEVRKGRRDMVRNFAVAPIDMKDAIERGKAAIVEQFRDLAWQSKHPFEEVNYAEWLAKKHEKAMQRSKEEAKKGHPGIAAEYAGLAADIKAEMDALPTAAAKANRDSATALAQLQTRVWELRNAAHRAFNESATWNGAATGFVIVPGHAAGGRTGPGPMLLGEEGPELFWPDRPGFVSTAPETAAILGGHQTLDVNVNLDYGAMAAAGFDTRGVASVVREVVGTVLRNASESAHIGSLLPSGL